MALPILVVIQVIISVVAMGALIAVVLQIGPLIEQKSALEAEINDLEELKKSHERNIEQLVNQLQEQQTTASIQAIEPQARSERVTGAQTTSGRAIYKYTLWLEVPAQLKSRIERVQYKLDHPSFAQDTVASSNEADGFAVNYRGWGCLAYVKITVMLKDGKVQPIYFNMCKALLAGGSSAPDR